VNVTSSTALGVEISPRLVASKGSGVAALAAAVAGLAYSVSFVIPQDSLLARLFLMLGGVLAVPVLVGLAVRLGQRLPVSALVAIVLALAAALGSAVHGGFDLANQLHPPATLPPDLPNPVDPRGLLSFGVAGLALVILGFVVTRSGRIPRWLGFIAAVDGVLLVALYLARLIILDPASPLVLVPALLTGFIMNPAWYGGLALWFIRRRRP
jgi:hypothetical protein